MILLSYYDHDISFMTIRGTYIAWENWGGSSLRKRGTERLEFKNVKNYRQSEETMSKSNPTTVNKSTSTIDMNFDDHQWYHCAFCKSTKSMQVC